MSEVPALPPDVELVRVTDEFTAETTPAGLKHAHQIAAGVWGRLRVLSGVVTFVLEATGERRQLEAGASQVIEPEVAHHVEVGPEGSFVVEFYR
jgi:tellurite resistance-related uncharacterized protein